MQYLEPIKTSFLSLDSYIHVQGHGEIKSITSDVDYLAASFTKKINNGKKRVICFWNLSGGDVLNKTEYKTNLDTRPVMQNNSFGCFFTDKTRTRYVLGYIDSQTHDKQKMPYTEMPNLSIEDLTGVTIGKGRKACKMMFWDLFRMQPVSTIKTDWHKRNLCALVPSASHLAVTLQSDTDSKPNIISLWDSRVAKNPVKKTTVHEDKNIHSMVILQTSDGPRIITSSVDNSAIDFRNLFKEAFGETIKIYNAQKSGDLDKCSDVPENTRSNSLSGYSLSFLNSKGSTLNTSTTYKWYTGEFDEGNFTIASQVTVRSYDVNSQEESIEPRPVIEFPADTKENPKYTFACDTEKVVFAEKNSDSNIKKIGIYKIEKEDAE